jgi:hypothetical protein
MFCARFKAARRRKATLTGIGNDQLPEICGEFDMEGLVRESSLTAGGYHAIFA